MREYLVRKGKYKGLHIIYENADEFMKATGNPKPRRWAVDDITQSVTGDWIQAEDGYVTQILYYFQFKDKRTWVFRFPMGSFAAWRGKTGITKYRQFYAMFSVPNKGTLSQVNYSTSRMKDITKLRFATLVIAGMPLRDALVIANPIYKHTLNIYQAESKIRRLLMDEVVQAEIKRHVEAFKDDVKEVITLKDIVDRIKRHWDNVQKGSAQELKAIEFAMQIHDAITPDERGRGKRINNIGDTEEAKFTEEAAPLLGEQGKD